MTQTWLKLFPLWGASNSSQYTVHRMLKIKIYMCRGGFVVFPKEGLKFGTQEFAKVAARQGSSEQLGLYLDLSAHQHSKAFGKVFLSWATVAFVYN